MIRDEIWKVYKANQDLKSKNALIEKYVYMIKIVASRMYNFYGGNVEFDDLVGYGALGLIDAIEKFDIKREVKFETYAQLRIRGAIIDNLRKNDWVPRTLRKKAKLIQNTINELENQTGSIVSNQDISKKIDISVDEVEKIINEIHLFNITSLDETIYKTGKEPLDMSESPENKIEEKEFLNKLTHSIEKLSKKEKKVITLYYYEELNYKEIGNILNLSESRISQIHSKAIKDLKNKLI